MQLITLALGFLSVAAAGAVEKRQTGTLAVSFPAFAASNTTLASSVSGSISFTATSSGVSVVVSLSASAARKRQAAAGISYTIHTGPASAGCGAVGPIAAGGDLSAQGGLAFPPTSFTFVSTAITLAGIAGDSVVLAYADGTIIGCANIAPAAAPVPTTSVTVNVNVNVNVAISIGVCGYCAAITTAYYSAVYIPVACTTYFFGVPYVCAGQGWINVLCPLTIGPGSTTTVYTAPKVTYVVPLTVTTYTSSCACATPSTTVVTVPASAVTISTATITTVPATTLPSTGVAAASTGVTVVTSKAAVAQISVGAASNNKAVGALAALAAVAALF